MKRILLYLSLALLSGCGKQPHASPTPEAEPTMVTITQYHDSDPSFHVQLPSPQARKLYRDIMHLPPAPPGPISCPADNGVYYELKFTSSSNQTLMDASLQAAGCRMLICGNRAYWTLDPQGDVFWSDLQTYLHMSSDELDGYSRR
ncbi:MAG: hypothetical protein K6T81_00420 [Alicyclobacillus macrosporangiidus]|uniref:hypothetical protein n=1 Tax=Alicyclobacillus macrosporangiidus TaxID=392015 RepID=UPI0026F05372|nr:hypothetical protein [Alicyclobacillus macrosporangiidus]MCL6597186.1 hypothetical protein [Alicyclobacillus macrosporangiidus]